MSAIARCWAMWASSNSSPRWASGETSAPAISVRPRAKQPTRQAGIARPSRASVVARRPYAAATRTKPAIWIGSRVPPPTCPRTGVIAAQATDAPDPPLEPVDAAEEHHQRDHAQGHDAEHDRVSGALVQL